MDEAVAGHANRIEMELHADFSLTVRDNGRGMPVDPHPKFPGKSALEVILCMLHAGGKFSGDAYADLRRPARRRRLGRQRALRPAGGRGGAQPPALPPGILPRPSPRADPGARPGAEPARHHGHLPPRPRDLRRLGPPQAGAPAPDGALQGLPLLRRRDPLALRRRVPRRRRRHPRAGDLPLPRRPRRLPRRAPRRRAVLCGQALRRQGRLRRALRRRHRRIGRVGGQLDAAARRLRFLLLQHHPDAGGRHPRAGLLGGDPQGPPRATASSPATARRRRSAATT